MGKGSGIVALAVFLGAGGLSLAAPGPAQAQSRGYPYSIMQEEGGARVAPKARSTQRKAAPASNAKQAPAKEAKQPIRRARGSSSPPPPPPGSIVTPLGVAPRIIETEPVRRPGSPPMIVPGIESNIGPAQTPGRPPGQGFQDRAIGCVHTGSSIGVAPGQIGTYTRSCVNQ